MFLVIKDVINFSTEPKCRGYFSQDLVDVSHVNLFAHFPQIYIRNWVGGEWMAGQGQGSAGVEVWGWASGQCVAVKGADREA